MTVRQCRLEINQIPYAIQMFQFFGREIPDFTWELTDRADELKKLL